MSIPTYPYESPKKSFYCLMNMVYWRQETRNSGYKDNPFSSTAAPKDLPHPEIVLYFRRYLTSKILYIAFHKYSFLVP